MALPLEVLTNIKILIALNVYFFYFTILPVLPHIKIAHTRT